MFQIPFRLVVVLYSLAYSSFGCNQQSQMSRWQPEIRPGRKMEAVKIKTTTPRPQDSPVDPPKKPKPADNDPRCQLQISEVNADNVGQNFKRYVELSMKCGTRSGPTPKNPLTGHRLMIFKANPLQLVFTYNFDNPEFQINAKKEFIVIGSPGVDNLDINLKSRCVQNIYTNSFNVNLLPSGYDDEFAVVLAYSQSKTALKAFKLIEASSYYPKILKTDTDIELLHSCIADMLLYGNPQKFPESNLLKLLPDSVAKTQWLTIRNWNSRKTKDVDLSINRCCTHTNGFTPSCFSLGQLTPGGPNDCSQHLQSPAKPQIPCLAEVAKAHPNLNKLKDSYLSISLRSDGRLPTILQ